MATNILALPLVRLTVETGTNEDWIDTLKYVVDDGSPDPPQLDLRGIRFRMEVRRRPEDHEVIISASTDDGTLTIGTSPDYGVLIFNIPDDIMKLKKAGVYVGDVLASDETFARVAIQIDLTVVEGITKPPVFAQSTTYAA
jgi:hypothetical protein